jgi:hypothetical protein
MRKVRTLRGQITATGGKAQKQLILNDQLINRGLRVTGFFVWPTVCDRQSSRQFNAILSYAELGNADVLMDSGDNTQIGWSFQSNTTSSDIGTPNAAPPAFSGYFNQLIDPDHIINRDLFISLRLSDNQTYNYLVVCELMDLTDSEAIITIVKENSQSLV